MLRLNAVRTGFVLGISLIIAAIIYFFAANWGGIHRIEKVWLVAGLVIFFYSLFFIFYLFKDRLGYHFFLARIFLVGGCIAFGTAIALLDQIYNAHANSYTLFLIWSIAALIFAWITRYPPFDMLSYILIHITIWFYVTDYLIASTLTEWSILLILLGIALFNLALWALSEWTRLHSSWLTIVSFIVFHFMLIMTTNSLWLEHYGLGMNIVSLIAIGLGFYYFIVVRWNKTMLALNALVTSSFAVFKFIELAIREGSFAFFVYGLIFVTVLLTVNVQFFRYIHRKSKNSESSVSISDQSDAKQASAEKNSDVVVRSVLRMIKIIGVVIGSISLMGVVFLATGLEDPEYTLLGLALLFLIAMIIFKNVYDVVRYTLLTISYIAGIVGIIGVEYVVWSALFTLVLIIAWLRSEGKAQLFITYTFIQLSTGILLFQWLDSLGVEPIFQIIILILAIINIVLYIIHKIRQQNIWGPSSAINTLFYGLLLLLILTFFENFFAHSYILFNLLYFVGVTGLVFWYIRREQRAELILSLLFWFAFLFYKYYDLLWKLLHKSITLAVLGVVIVVFTYWIARQRQLVTHESNLALTSSLRKYGLTMISIVIVLQLGWISYHTVVKEQLLASGTAIILALAPIDPRSLLQGDYVILNYDISTLPESIAPSLLDQNIHSGRVQLVLQPNSNGIYTIDRLYNPNEILQKNEVLINGQLLYDNQVSYGIENYFIPEGTGLEVERTAKFASIRVSAEGDALLEKVITE